MANKLKIKEVDLENATVIKRSTIYGWLVTFLALIGVLTYYGYGTAMDYNVEHNMVELSKSGKVALTMVDGESTVYYEQSVKGNGIRILTIPESEAIHNLKNCGCLIIFK